MASQVSSLEVEADVVIYKYGCSRHEVCFYLYIYLTFYRRHSYVLDEVKSPLRGLITDAGETRGGDATGAKCHRFPLSLASSFVASFPHSLSQFWSVQRDVVVLYGIVRVKRPGDKVTFVHDAFHLFLFPRP